MKKVNKIYQHLYTKNLYTDVKTGEKDNDKNPIVKSVAFTGANLFRKQGGVFSTTDPELQSFIEQDPRFAKTKREGFGKPGKEFFLRETITIPDRPADEVAQILNEEMGTIYDQEEKDQPEDFIETKKVYEEVVNGQQARDVLFGLYPDLTMKEVINIPTIKAFCIKNNIDFPNWPKFKK